MAATVVGPQRLDPNTLAALAQRRLDPLEKALPPGSAGLTAAEFLATDPRLSAFATPLLVLEASAINANVARMAEWCARRGVGLAPHGKTTMAPVLWEQQLAAGAWGITLATPSQVRVALAFGLRRVQLANALVDPVGITAVSRALDADPGLQVLSWVDSVRSVAAMDAVLTELRPARPLTVLVELGAPGGRTGARDLSTARDVAAAVVASPHLHLGGVAGYEGALAHDASPAGLDVVRRYLRDLAALHADLAGTYEVDEVVVTAGGSAFFDDVADVLGPLAGPGTCVLLRSGAYVIHDDGFYRGISPLSRHGDTPLISAMHAWTRVVSRPEPGLVLLDAGKRDIPFDEGLPEPQLAADALGAPARPLSGEITAVNDQHAFLRLDPGTTLDVGHVVRLGLSHPCTAFDKWREIPVIDGTAGSATDPVVVDLVRTYF
ncbi:type III PLP-dependent enzyme domain-containing protein [Pseudonocardia charpentierae]|uniref:Amino acid deaminase n=1 Tax=Pseudonocardia charpentierae TaxID=3075545 RepID=A0ABU2NDT9_9PSEU|nr:amino acid deaminase [Pseudonocardia sp. DSM 45834]MDT0352128.1 amino acid deaminase [Pseudonocardia sp. DSM 45834]